MKKKNTIVRKKKNESKTLKFNLKKNTLKTSLMKLTFFFFNLHLNLSNIS